MTDQAFRLPEKRPADRYGDRPAHPRRRWLLVLVGGGLAVLAVAWWIWIAVVHTTPAVRYELLAFRPVSTSSIEIHYSVTRDPETTVACILRARGVDGQEVGRRQVIVTPEGAARTDLTSTVATTSRAVSAEVLICRPYDQPDGYRKPEDADLPTPASPTCYPDDSGTTCATPCIWAVPSCNRHHPTA